MGGGPKQGTVNLVGGPSYPSVDRVFKVISIVVGIVTLRPALLLSGGRVGGAGLGRTKRRRERRGGGGFVCQIYETGAVTKLTSVGGNKTGGMAEVRFPAGLSLAFLAEKLNLCLFWRRVFLMGNMAAGVEGPSTLNY